MAEEVQIAGTDARAKIRNPLAPALLPFITFGIYTLVWYYRINKELAEMGRARNTDELGTSPGTSLLAVLVGWIVIVPPFLSVYNTWKRAVAAERLTGVPGGMEAGLGFLLSILLSPVGYYILQRDLNNVWQAQAGGGAPQAAIPEGAPATPPAPPPPAPESVQAPPPAGGAPPPPPPTGGDSA
jgi:Domain of unknown function (DUF4234)